MVKGSPPLNHKQEKISVVFVTYHTGTPLFPALEKILDQKEVGQIVVVNNGNPEDVERELINIAEEDARVTLISGQGNVGFAKGCNLGVYHAICDVLLFLNPDGFIPSGGISRFLEDAASFDGPWLVGGRLLESSGEEQPGSRREELTPLRALGEALGFHRLFPDSALAFKFNLHCESLPSQTIEVPVISGACMMLPKKDYWAIGGMDEDYFLHVEDIDFCHRFRKAGGKVYFCPHVSIVHHKSTSDAPKIFVEWHKTKGFWTYFRKHFKGAYPPGFLGLVNIGIFSRFLMVAGKSFLGGAVQKVSKRASKDRDAT